MKRTQVVLSVLCALALVGCSSRNKLELGGACSLNSDCQDGLLCKFGACHKACVKSVDCATGERCVQVDGVAVCQMASEGSCDQYGNCQSPLSCRTVDNTCRNACTINDMCLGGEVCLETFCVGVGEIPGRPDGSAGPSDTTVRDAGGPDILSATTPDSRHAIDLATRDMNLGTYDFLSGLILHYDFNGDVQDTSGNGNHGKVQGAIRYAGGAKGDLAVVFDNPTGMFVATQWIGIPYSSTIRSLETDSFTVVLLYKTEDSSGNNGRLFGHFPPSIAIDYNGHIAQQAFGALADGTKTYFLGYPTATNPISTTDGGFHCQVMVLDRRTATAQHYVDGVETHSLTNVALNALDFNGLVVGATLESDTYGAKAVVDDLRLYNRPFNASEVETLCRQMAP
jgi:hypothetical protein